MNKIKVFAAIFSALASVVMSVQTVKADTYGETLEYIICNNEAVITGIEGNPKVIELPSEIDGKPVSEIRENAFFKCDSLEKVVIPNSVKKIGSYAFFDCTSLEKAVIKGNIKEIKEGCFYGCSSLKEVKLPETLEKIEKYSFYYCCNMNSVVIPDNVAKIGEYAFADCKMLNNVLLSHNLTNIEAFAFLRCSSLYEINIPESVLNIGSCALGFEGEKKFVPSENFQIYGNKNSFGKVYAQENNMKFKNIFEKKKKTPRKTLPEIPVFLVIVSGTGLFLIRYINKISIFEYKYEYEK